MAKVMCEFVKPEGRDGKPYNAIALTNGVNREQRFSTTFQLVADLVSQAGGDLTRIPAKVVHPNLRSAADWKNHIHPGGSKPKASVKPTVKGLQQELLELKALLLQSLGKAEPLAPAAPVETPKASDGQFSREEVADMLTQGVSAEDILRLQMSL